MQNRDVPAHLVAILAAGIGAAAAWLTGRRMRVKRADSLAEAREQGRAEGLTEAMHVSPDALRSLQAIAKQIQR